MTNCLYKDYSSSGEALLQKAGQGNDTSRRTGGEEGATCCLPRRKGALGVAWTEVTLLLAFFLLLLGDLMWRSEGRVLKQGAMMMSCLIHLVLACLLLHAIREVDLRKVWAWVWVRAVVLVTDLVVGVVEAMDGRPEEIYAVSFFCFGLLSFGNIWIVRAFALELEQGPHLHSR